jgi:hypothetical protein
MIGAEILVNALAEEGVEYVWGYPGGAVLYIYDELYKQTNSNTCWCATSRPPCMPLTAMPARPARWAWRW